MEIITGHNSTFAIGGVSCSADSFVVKESFVLRINICGKNPAHHKSANRYDQYYHFLNNFDSCAKYLSKLQTKLANCQFITIFDKTKAKCQIW